ncbi:Uncharacterized conserved protein YutE, UPF0331/DUF86 family [Marininema mesophilum]|uniref:Uncharacterized conserved protein YutE, UPF0331/DUF86 family n=1 Tax=Marininema mesophilum TaxID=1048340 RepID=A0A1H3CGP0_9BACL|nr:DUF86 domain-containing protein [Marininema mesophilum]SDX52659.1 Uncharacterized conserved protein YutE, UPF0331/DUF86 family [Marininema mesophilum]
MFYEVDTQRIDKQLVYLARCSNVLEATKIPMDEQDEIAFFAVSRALHIAIECVIDAGDALIDGFIMRDPGGYSDIIDILEDEKVIPQEGAIRLKELIRVRERLVRRYVEIDIRELSQELKGVAVFGKCVTWIRSYLQQELGAGYVSNKGGLNVEK